MLTKETRLALIKSRAKVICGVGLSLGFIPVSKAEIQEAAQEVVNPLVRRENDDSIQEEEETGFAPTFSFDSIHEENDSCLLSPKEKRQLAKDLLLAKR